MSIHHDHTNLAARRVADQVERLIMATPTGYLRNVLTNVQIILGEVRQFLPALTDFWKSKGAPEKTTALLEILNRYWGRPA